MNPPLFHERASCLSGRNTRDANETGQGGAPLTFTRERTTLMRFVHPYNEKTEEGKIDIFMIFRYM